MEFRILGPLEVLEGGQPLEVGGSKQRTLLAALLLHANEVVSADCLVEALWDDVAPPSSHKALQVHVSHLRKVLGRDRIETKEPGYVLSVQGGELDRQRFEQLAALGDYEGALRLWRGTPLPEFRYQDFAQAEIARLEELHFTCLEHRIDLALREGRHEDVVGDLEALVTEHPLREGLRGRLMTSLYRGGRQAEALAVYREGRRLLCEELGIEPSEQLVELELAILRHDASLDPPAESTDAALGVPPMPQSPPRHTAGLRILPGLVGRRRAISAAGAIVLAAAIASLVVLLVRDERRGTLTVSPDAVGVVDGRSSRLVGTIPLPGRPSLVAVDDGLVWVASETARTLVAISRSTLAVIRVVAPNVALSDLAADGRGALWALDEDRRLVVKIDSAYGSVAGRFELPPAAPLPEARRVLARVRLDAAGGAVWATDGSTRLLRLDSATGRVRVAVDLASPLTDVSVGPGAVWAISGEEATVFRVNPRGVVTDRIQLVSRAGVTAPFPVAVAAGNDAVWVLNGNTATVTRVDPRAGGVAATIALGVGANPASIAVGTDALWVANSANGTLARIDSETNEVRVITIGGSPAAVAADASRVWVTVQPSFGLEPHPVGISGLQGRLPALPGAFCSPVFFGGAGTPDVLIASDLPLQSFVALRQTLQMSDAIRFVLARRGFRAGTLSVGYQSCDDSSAQTRTWTPATCRRNARAYARQANVLGVVGTYNSGCSQVELPILAGAAGGPVVMISPSNTYIGLTHGGPGVRPGEPERYYPGGVRTFARVVVADDVQGAANALLAKRLDLTSLYLLHDGTPYGRGVAWSVRTAAATLGIEIAGFESWDPAARTYAPLARRVARSRPDGVFLGGAIDMNGPAVVRGLRAALGKGVRMLASDAFMPISLLTEETGPAAEGMTISFPGVVASELGDPGRQFAADFEDAVAGDVSPFSIATAQATEVLLDAIGRSDGTRASVVEELFQTRVEDGILGTFSFDRNGDTTAGAVTIFQIENGKESVLAVITPPPRLR